MQIVPNRIGLKPAGAPPRRRSVGTWAGPSGPALSRDRHVRLEKKEIEQRIEEFARLYGRIPRGDPQRPEILAGLRNLSLLSVTLQAAAEN
jgi:hypothetical protein